MYETNNLEANLQVFSSHLYSDYKKTQNKKIQHKNSTQKTRLLLRILIDFSDNLVISLIWNE